MIKYKHNLLNSYYFIPGIEYWRLAAYPKERRQRNSVQISQNCQG
jgi:hypothetical protein